ncbi:hypothetical protein B0G62_110174 [Paraburkholderia eburnea]|uniref:Uncharacterized protein n=1 Tax=Paraburkholderia eburnea TaxID=1189126 RepID=A0A2S4M562_9BURK|nr:hypothetical protein B0G62_110174 [Paraburkholderia eburnea]PRZ20294.1 hypothetical protein BX588_112174 [Paraburkholderia eburnea]
MSRRGPEIGACDGDFHDSDYPEPVTTRLRE